MRKPDPEKCAGSGDRLARAEGYAERFASGSTCGQIALKLSLGPRGTLLPREV